MKEWLEVIRDSRYFNLLALNNKESDTDDAFEFATRHGNITVEYDVMYPITTVPTGLENPPNFIAVSDVSSFATPDSNPYNPTAHAEEPAPAQRAGNVAFIWGKTSNNHINPYRDDGFPAVIIAVSLSKYYYYGKLTRKPQHPAIKAEYLVAQWYENTPGTCYRNNGPSIITLENYKEYWVDGEYQGQKWTEFQEGWKHRVLSNTPDDEDTLGIFLENIQGTTSLFTSTYFVDQQDEVCYIADFA